MDMELSGSLGKVEPPYWDMGHGTWDKIRWAKIEGTDCQRVMKNGLKLAGVSVVVLGQNLMIQGTF